MAGACHSTFVMKNNTSSSSSSAPSAGDFLKQHPDVTHLEAFVVDINGVARGKSLPRASAAKIFKDGLRLPRSAFAFDIWGQDVIDAGLVAETGDNDGLCHPADGLVSVMPWTREDKSVTAQALMSMYETDGKPCFADPRHVLANVLARYKEASLTPVVAAELEFYLMDAMPDDFGRPQPPRNPRRGTRAHQSQTYGLDELADFAPVLSEITGACALQNIPADTLISENGPAQYEINLLHQPDALRAADDAVLLKRAIKGVAARHDMLASFMAKPYGDRSGNGLHVHFSIVDAEGRNIFSGEDATGSGALRHAIGGLLANMTDSTLVLAPHANSYRRFRVGSHAPTTLSWGYDNRSTALRIPASGIEATRIEYRVAGADANIYLVLAVILHAALEGIEQKAIAPEAIEGNAYQSGAVSLPRRWDDALALFEKSAFIDRVFGKDFKKVFAACKRQEMDIIDADVSSVEHDAYLRDS